MLLRSVTQKNVKNIANHFIMYIMTIIFNPTDFTIFAQNTIFYIIQIILTGHNLAADTLLHRLQIIRVNHTPKRIVRILPKILHTFTLENTQQAPVGINYFLTALGIINQKSAWHLIHKMLKRRRHLKI